MRAISSITHNSHCWRALQLLAAESRQFDGKERRQEFDTAMSYLISADARQIDFEAERFEQALRATRPRRYDRRGVVLAGVKIFSPSGLIAVGILVAELNVLRFNQTMLV